MTLYTAAIVQVGEERTPVRELYSKVRYALKITFHVGGVIWIISHDDMIPYLPAGASYLKARLTDAPMPNLNRNAGFNSGKSTSPTTTYSIVDVDDEFSDLLADKNANGHGSFNALIEEFEVGFEQQIDTDPDSITFTPPKYTGIIQDHDKPYNTVELETTDINRGLDEEIFDPLTWRLNSPISDTADTIQVTLPVDQVDDFQATFTHREWYPNPSATGGYAQIGEEIFWYTSFVVNNGVCEFQGVVRGQLRTTAAAVSIANTVKNEQKPQITEVIYIDEPATDLLKALITGYLPSGDVALPDRELPAHWSVKADARWINDVSFARYSTKLRLKFQSPAKAKCRAFYQAEILSLMGAVLVVDGQGRLNWTPRIRPIDENAGEIVFDPSNCVTTNVLSLKHIKTDIHPSVKINYDWDPIAEKFLQPVTYRDVESEQHNKIAPGKKVEEFSFKGLHSGVHTGTQLLKLAATYGDDFFYEKLSFTVESFINDIPLGELITVDFPNVIDDATGAANSAPLKRTMLVVESRENRATRTTTYTLSGSLYIQSKRQASQRLHNIEIEEYKRGKENIADLAGITIVDGIATGTISLVMGRHYYYVNDTTPGEGLEFSENLTVNILGQGPLVGIHVYGPFVNKTSIDLTARSTHFQGQGATETSNRTAGTTGYCLSSRSGSGFDTKQLYTSFVSSNQDVYSKTGLQVVGGRRGNSTRGLYSRAPDPLIDLNNGILGGIPPDLGGTSGPGGPVSKFTDPDRRPQGSTADPTAQNPSTQYIDGSDGGRGGGGLLIVSWGGSVEGNGVIILDGGDASPANTLVVADKTLEGARGGPGMPGSLLWVVDGNHSTPTLTGSNVQALPGDASSAATGVGFNQIINDAGSYRGLDGATPASNLYLSVSRIAYTPEPEDIQDRPLSVLDQFFANQRDGRVRIFVADVDPSNANFGDMRITQAELDANQDDAAFRILTDTGWRDFVRGTDNFEYVYDALIAGKRKYNSLEIVASPTRPVGEPDGTIWYNSSNGTEWILYENSDDILIRENQVPVGTNLIEDLSFARSGAGDKLWAFTRDDALAPINSKTSNTGSTSGGGGTNPTTGITLSDQGRTVAGVAYQDDGGGIIVAGRGGTVTLADTTVLPFTVGAGGAFSVTFPSANDNNLGQMASIYTQNAAAGTQAQLNFTYEL